MSMESWAERIAYRRGVMDGLIRETGIRRYGLFGVSAEGESLPDGSETASGMVVDQDGSVFSFWLDWDEKERRPALTHWEPVNTDADWLEEEEYLQARREAGLT
jgi:hypothetical protein